MSAGHRQADTKRRGKPTVVPSEAIEQRALATWLNLRGLAWTHCPNGGHRHMSVARELKLMGVKPGVPDILIFDPPPHCSAECRREGVCLRCLSKGSTMRLQPGKMFTRHDNLRPVGVAIELKRLKGGTLSEHQAGWLDALDQRGWLVLHCKGAQAAIEWLMGLGY